MESCEARMAQQLMEEMSNFVEEHHHVSMSYERGPLCGRRFREARNYGRNGVAPRAVRFVVSGDEGPDGGTLVFGL